jgi:enoyl-CoA hydratase/carnithine racemase
MLEAATEHIAKAGNDPAVRAILLTGTGRAFSSGADIGGDGEVGGPAATATLDAANALVAAIVEVPKLVVGAVNGLAAGVGATIALSCDLVVAKRSSYFLLAFVNIGLMPDGGASAVLPAAIGRVRAARMALLGERVPAATALEWGLISHLVEDDELDAEVSTLLARLAGGPTVSYARTKAALRQATLSLLPQAHAAERAGQIDLFDTADFAEGVAAFRDRRPARFEGR